MPADRDLIAEGQPVGDAAGWQRLAGKWRDKACDRRNELYVMYAVLEHALSRIAELEAERTQLHSALADRDDLYERLAELELALEAAQRPPLGYVVLAKAPSRTEPHIVEYANPSIGVYMEIAQADEARQQADSVTHHRAPAVYREGMSHVVAEVREVAEAAAERSQDA